MAYQECRWSRTEEHAGGSRTCLSHLFFIHIFIHLQESARQQEYSNRWLALDQDTKGKIKQDSLMTLGSTTQRAGGVAAQVVSAIAAVELPAAAWPDLIELLLSFVNNPDNVNLRIATLQTIGFICETIVCCCFRFWLSHGVLTLSLYRNRKF